jgi:hypothetical protein
MIEKAEVYDAIRRGYSDLANADEAEIDVYFSNVDGESISGHIGNIKGILFEQKYAEQLQDNGIDAVVYDAVNHPESDIMILDNGIVIEELQLKATENSTYIQETVESAGDEITIVTTTEIAKAFPGEVVDSGISEIVLEEAVSEVVAPFSTVSIIGWFFGIF